MENLRRTPPVFYVSPTASEEECEAVYDAVKRCMYSFGVNNEFELTLNEAILGNVLTMYSRDMDKLVTLDGMKESGKGPNVFKQAAGLVVWVARLKPIVGVTVKRHSPTDCYTISEIESYINEMFAVFMAFTLVDLYREDKSRMIGVGDFADLVTKPQFKNVLHVLRYRTVTRHSFELWLETFCRRGRLEAFSG